VLKTIEPSMWQCFSEAIYKLIIRSNEPNIKQLMDHSEQSGNQSRRVLSSHERLDSKRGILPPCYHTIVMRWTNMKCATLLVPLESTSPRQWYQL
jgi:hypothetical protein